MNDIIIIALFVSLIVIIIALLFITAKQYNIEIQLIRMNKNFDRYLRVGTLPEEYERDKNKIRNPNLGEYQPTSNHSHKRPPTNPPNQDTAGKPPNQGTSLRRNCKCR